MKRVNSTSGSMSILRGLLKISFVSLIIFFVSFKAFSADGDPFMNHVKRQYVVGQWGNTRWGLEYLPDDFYNTGTQKYPIIFFFHGIGETGSTEGTLNKLTVNGPSWFIANQAYNMQFVNPNTGILQKFIYVALQDPYFSPNPSEVDYIIKNNPRLKDRISGVFYTGLSAGGQQTMMSVLTNQDLANTVTGIVPMSSAGWDKNGVPFARASGVKAWCFHGTTDGTCPYSVTRDFNDSMGTARSRWTNLPPTHGNWNSIYTKDYKEIWNGKNINIYEWMLSLLPNNVAPIADAGPDQTFGSVVPTTNLAGQGMDPDGWVTNYNWNKLSGPAQYTILNVANPLTALTNLTTGTYKFELIVTDNMGAIGKDTVTIINSLVVTPIKLLDFNLKELPGLNQLSWKTATEDNSDFFSIERSSDGRTFNAIGQVAASGYTSSQVNYIFADNSLTTGVSYYRLRMVDKDARAEYSKVISTSAKTGAPLEILNASLSSSKNNVKLLVNSSQSTQGNLTVINAGGIVLLTMPVTLQKGVNSIEKNIGTLPKAVYYVKLFTAQGQIVKTLFAN